MDNKKNILAWLTGNYTTQAGNNIPRFPYPVKEKTNNFLSQMQSAFPEGFFISNILQTKSAGKIVIYGVYNQGTTVKGFIVLLDRNFSILQIIRKYDSGTDLRNFMFLGIDEEGNFFGIDEDVITSPSVQPQRRFLLLNNFSVKLPNQTEYEIHLRKSYILSGEIAKITQVAKIIKAYNQSRYLIAGQKLNASNIMIPAVAELKINTGTSNEWINYTYSNSFIVVDAYASWTNEGVLSMVLGGFVDNETSLSMGMLKTTGPDTLNLTIFGAGLVDTIGFSAAVYNMDTIYYSITQLINPTTSSLLVYRVKNGIQENVFREPSTHGTETEEGVGLFCKDEEVFFQITLQNDTTNNQWKVGAGRIIDLLHYQTTIASFPVTPPPILVLPVFVLKDFNLYNYYIQIDNTIYTLQQIYNSNNYNGIGYNGTNAMIPHSANILDSNNDFVFSRNLYNLAVVENITNATLQIPNNYANDILLDKAELISETNKKLNINDISITTNIYEEILLNFINSLSMQDQNDIDNITTNLAGAIRLNQSISKVKDYENTKMTKLRINYANNTNEIISCSWNMLDDTNYELSQNITLASEVKNIQIISEDTATTYLTIVPEIKTGTITLRQKVKIL